MPAAPAGSLFMMIGVWLAISFFGGFLAGYLGSLWSGMAKPHFFLMLAVIVAFAGVTILAFDRPLKANLRE
jgi:proton-dependent oligopeptide transporter, POT family